VDHADLERLDRRQRRQDAGQALRQHRLAGPGRADRSRNTDRSYMMNKKTRPR
jgi:hypothetical protein